MFSKLSRMTSVEFKAELSIAGNPDKIMEMEQKILGVMAQVNENNAAELINLELLMRKLAGEAKTWCRLYEQKTGQKII